MLILGINQKRRNTMINIEEKKSFFKKNRLGKKILKLGKNKKLY